MNEMSQSSSSLFVCVKTISKAISLSDVVPPTSSYCVWLCQTSCFRAAAHVAPVPPNLGGQTGCPPSLLGAFVCIFISVQEVAPKT